MNIFRKIASWFQPTKEVSYYADYVCKLPWNWIPGNDILVDTQFTLEAIEQANYKECVEDLNHGCKDSLHKTEPIEDIQWTPLKITHPTWGEDN